MGLDKQKAYDIAVRRDNQWYDSETYKNHKKRYELYRDAYYRKHSTSNPVWKSKLFFPVFFLACKAFEAEVKATLQDPIVNINFKNKGKYNPELDEKEKLLNYDIMNDLYISGYESTVFRMYWFNEICGTSVGRETFVSEKKLTKSKSVIVDQFGNRVISQNSSVSSTEHTDTNCIHTLNFAHALNKGEFYDSPWATVRYEISISDLYGLKEHPLANKKGIDMVIKEIEKGDSKGWTDGDDSYYVDNNDYKDGDQDTIIGTEYSGNLQYRGNESDNTLYWGVFAKRYGVWLLLGPSPFQRHPFWKMRTYPDPFGPFGVAPNSTLIPVNILKNTLFNQYVDFTNANLKYLYQVFSPGIQGGLQSLVDGNPGGLVEAIDEITWKQGDLIKPIRKESGGIPGMADAFGILEKTEVEAAVASPRRKTAEGITETATGELEIAKQQDAQIESITRDMDNGLKDSIHQKVWNRLKYVIGEQRATIGQIESESPDVLYFPFELGGEAFDVTVNRKSPVEEANKYMAFLAKVSEGMAIVQSGGGMLDPQAVMGIYEEVGQKIGLDKVDRIWMQQQGLPPQVQGQGQGGAGTNINNIPKAKEPVLPAVEGVANGQAATAVV